MRARTIVQRIVLGFAVVWGCSASGETLALANNYLTGLDTDTTNIVSVARNFAAILDGPLTGSSTLTLKGGYVNTLSSMLSLINSAGNTFNGDIVVDVDGGTLKIAGNPYATSAPGLQGFNLPGITAANTITVRRGAMFYIEDNAVSGATTYLADRLGSENNRPSVRLAGGSLKLNGPAVAALASTQTVGTLILDSGPSAIDVLRAHATATPKLASSSVSPAPGATVNFTGTSLGTAASGAAQVVFNTAPALIGGIIGGYARSGNEWATYGANGVTALASYEVTLQGAAATDNIKVTAAQTITSDNTINSLNWNLNGNLDLQTYALTLVSGGYLKQNNAANSLFGTTGYVTAGSGAGGTNALSVHQNMNQVLVWSALVKDNPVGSGNAVAFVKDGAISGSVSFTQADDNDYSGGTFVNTGTLQTGPVADRRYLGTGPVRVDNAFLTLGAVGATANATGADYTAVNGAQITIPNVAHSSADTFDIGPNSVITYVTGIVGLNSLDRTDNIALSEDAVIGHPALTAALNLDAGTIKNLGTVADLYYGLAANQANPAGSITLGAGTPFKGLSTDRAARLWQLGTINVAAGTSEIYLQGLAVPGAVPVVLTLGNGTTAGGPVISLAAASTVDVTIVGNVTLDDDTAIFGDTEAGKFVRFVVLPGATLTVNRAGGLGSGSGIASVVVRAGGTLTAGDSAGLNGEVTVEVGGRLVANQPGGLVGTGTLNFAPESIIDITGVTGFSGSQAAATALPPGVIVRLDVASFGSTVEALDTYLGSKAPIYEIFGADRGAAMPVSPGMTIMTLNRGTNGLGGMLVNDIVSRSLAAAANSKIVIGPNGGVMAATTNLTLTVPQAIELGINELIIGTAPSLDGAPPKAGTVTLSAPVGYNTALPGGRITVNPGATLSQTANAIPDEADITVNGEWNLGGAETIGSLAGNGTVRIGGQTLTVGRNNASTNFSGAFGGAGAFVKTGSGRLDLTGNLTNTSAFTVNDGILALSGAGQTTNTGTAAYTVIGNGALVLDNADVNDGNRLAGALPGITFQGGTFRFVGKAGAASSESLGAATFSGGASTIDIQNGTGAGSSAEVTFSALTGNPLGTINFTASGEGTLGAAGDSPRVRFATGATAGKVVGFATVGGAPALYDTTTGIRAFDIETDGTEFDGEVNQSGIDTVFTIANIRPTLTTARSVNSLWIDSPGASKFIDLGNTGASNLTVSTGRILLTGVNDFEIKRSDSSTATLIGPRFYLGVDDPSATLTLNAPLNGTATYVTKEGAGTLTVNAAETFTAGLIINQGLVKYGATGDLAAVPLTIWGGAFDVSGKTDTLGAVAIYAGGITNSVSGGELTIGALTMGSGPAGSSAFVNTGSGTLKLGNTVTYNVVNDPDTATIAGNLDLNGARIFTINDSVAPGAAIDLDVSAVVANSTAGSLLTKNGTGTMRLGGANTFDGPVTAGGGTLRLSNPQALGSPSMARALNVTAGSLAFDGTSGNINVPANYTTMSLTGGGDLLLGPISGALVNMSGNNTVPSAITLAGTTYLASLGGKLTLSGNIGGTQHLYLFGDGDTELGGTLGTGTGQLIKYGNGTSTLSGGAANTFSGVTTINGGTVLLNKTANIAAIPGGGAVTVNSGGQLKYAGANNMIGDAVALTLNGSGQLDLNGARDTIGAVTINAGGAPGDTTNQLNSGSGGNLSFTTLTITPQPGFVTTLDSGSGTNTLGGTLTFNAASTGRAKISGNLDLGNAARTFTVGDGLHPDYDLFIDAAISSLQGAFGIIKGTLVSKLVLAGNNSYTGINTLSGGILRAQDNANALGLNASTTALTLNVAGTELQLAGDTALNFGRNASISADLQITSDRSTPGVGVTHSLGALAITAGRTLTVAGGANVNAGVAGVTFANCALAGAAIFNLPKPAAGGIAMLTIDGPLSGTAAVTKNGPGILKLAGASSYSGTMTVVAGQVTLAQALAGQNNTVNNLAVRGLGFSDDTAFTIGALTGSGTIALTNAAGAAVTLAVGNNNASATYTGVLNGSGGLIKLGTGTQILANVTPLQYQGNTGVSNGVLQLNSPILPAVGEVTLASPGKLNLNFTGTNDIKLLTVNGTNYTDGVYSSINLPGFITGPGALRLSASAPLVCAIQVDKATGASNELFTFSGLYSGVNTAIAAYAWDFGDDGSVESNTATASHQYTTSGVYTVRLTVTNAVLETATTLWTGTLFIYPEHAKVWDGEGLADLASDPVNWVGDIAPVAGDAIVLNEISWKNMTWDLDIPIQSWTQVGYGGTAAIGTLYGASGFTNLVITGDCTINNGAWTHTANPRWVNYEVSRLSAMIGGNLIIGANGEINVRGMGYSTGTFGPGGDGNGGGSYGGRGWGGTFPQCYGSIVSPTNLGSGGRESSGGGAILLTVGGTIQNDGLICADGAGLEANVGYWGSGSGGSIWLTAGTLTGGIGGVIRANGGTCASGRASGGGRIALVVTNTGADLSGFTGVISAYNGWAGGGGSAGTIYRETAADFGKGELIVNNYGGTRGYAVLNTDLSGTEAVTYEFSRIILTNGGVLNIGSNDTLIATNTMIIGQHTLTNGIWISGGTLLTPPTFVYSNFFIGISGSGSTFSPSTSLTIPTNAIFLVDQPHEMTCDVTIQPGGLLTHTPNPGANTESYKVDLTVNGALSVENGGSVDVTGRGFPLNYGPGTPLVGSVGASHGGLGVGGLACYGSIVAPTNLGSGGRSSGAGGGAIRLAVSGVVSNGGGIFANAAMVTANTGAGGSVAIIAGSLVGTGPIEANSATNVTGANPGGGGRVAVAVTHAGENVFAYAGPITAYGGRKPAALSGGAGTVYLRDPGQGLYDGTLIVDNDTLNGLGTEISSSVTDTTVANMFIQRSGNLLLNTNQTVTVSGVWSNSATFEGLTDSAVIFGGVAGSTSTVYGTTTFMGLTCVQPGKILQFAAESTNAVAAYGRLILRGDAATNLILRSTAPGTAWYLNADALVEQNIEFVDVTDSDAASGAEIIAKNSAGQYQNNVHWKFLNVMAGETIVWTGTDNTLWTGVGNWDRPRAPVETDVIVIPGGRPNYPVFDAARTVNRLDIQAGGSVSLNGYDLTVTNAAVIAGALTASGTEIVTFLAGVNFTSGTFTPAFSTIVLAGDSAQSVNLGEQTFYKARVDNSAAAVSFTAGFKATELRCEAPSGMRSLNFAHNATVTLRDLVLRGASPAATNILLRSTILGQKWNLAVSGYRSVQGVDVRDSDASVGLLIPALSSADSGGNVNWTFGVAPTMWTPTSGNSFHTAANWTPAVVPDGTTRVLVESGAAMTMTGAVSVLDFTVGGGSGAVSVTVNGLLTVGEDLIVLSNGTLAINQPCVVSNGLYVLANGTLTHSANTDSEINKLTLTVMGNLWVDPNGAMDVTGMGYAGGKGPGAGTGAGYGGRGSDGYAGSIPSGLCYGSIMSPTNLGSSGAGGYGSPAGGGAIRLMVSGSVRNDGLVVANGRRYDGDMGSGGSIWLTAGAVTGIGAMQANGGESTGGHSEGGGGRVSLVVTNMGADFSFYTGTIQARSTSVMPGGTSAGGAGAGTVYKQRAADRWGRGAVLVDNCGLTASGPTDLPAYTNGIAGEADRAVFHVVNAARLRLANDFMVGDIWLDTANAVLDLGSNTLTVNTRKHELGLGSVVNYGAIVWAGLPPGMLIIVK